MCRTYTQSIFGLVVEISNRDARHFDVPLVVIIDCIIIIDFGSVKRSVVRAEDELAGMEDITSASECAPEVALVGTLARYRQMVADLSGATGARIGEVRDALRQLLGEVRVGVDAAGRPVARLGLHVSDGSGGRICLQYSSD